MLKPIVRFLIVFALFYLAVQAVQYAIDCRNSINAVTLKRMV